LPALDEGIIATAPDRVKKRAKSRG
jgi:hypothetical protein